MADCPHFSLPFRLGPTAAVCEQDSVEEIAGCVLAILLCPVGYRSELPTFGIIDPTFTTPVDLDALRGSIDLWEPRAVIALEQLELDDVDELIARLQVAVGIRSEE